MDSSKRCLCFSGRNLDDVIFLWPKTSCFVKLALYSTINCPPKGEVNSGESCFSIYQISRLRMKKLCLRFNRQCLFDVHDSASTSVSKQFSTISKHRKVKPRRLLGICWNNYFISRLTVPKRNAILTSISKQ